jgi:acyl-coenzyme A synthetase/AMP-(fatty) acid ligase
MLCFGGTLHMVLPDIAMIPEQFVRYLVNHRITSTYIPPALLSDVVSALEQQPAPLSLKRLLVGVEPIPQRTLQRFRALAEEMCIVNGYGPTESTVCATLFPFSTATEPDRRTPIGTKINVYEVYLLDAHMQPVPIGMHGEVYIGGLGLARGYINQPALTAERFIPHPFHATPGARLYKTGDLARYLPDGHLEFLGRRDQQIKLHGYRIELAEIETVLQQHPAVREAVVLAPEETQDDTRALVAYLVATQEPPPTSQSLRAFLLQKLPAYMVPTRFIVLERLPRTPQGKIHRQALPVPDALRSPRTVPFAAPQTYVETTLANIWADVLKCDRVGI